MTVHKFRDSLALSHAQEDAPWWPLVYREAFPNLVAMPSVRKDGWAQRGGIDRQLVLADGSVLKVDEKVRYKDYPDILLEVWSDRDRQIKGWIQKDLTCDFIAYAFVPSQTCYLFPYRTLRRAWMTNAGDWWERYPHKEANNGTYVTESVAIPKDVLRASLTQAMVVTWNLPLEIRLDL